MNYETAIKKVKKLLSLAESDNVYEAGLAASMAQDIMDRHKISRMALEDAGDVDEEVPVNFKHKDAPLDDKFGKAMIMWRLELARVVARSNQCRVWCIPGHARTQRLDIFGRPSDVETVRYLYAFLQREINRLCSRDGRGCGRTWRNNFRRGAVQELDVMMREAQRESMEEFKVSSSTDLVPISNLVRLEKRDAGTLDAMKNDGFRWVSNRNNSTRNYSAMNAGRDAAREINLGSSAGGIGSGAKEIESC